MQGLSSGLTAEWLQYVLDGLFQVIAAKGKKMKNQAAAEGNVTITRASL